MVQPLINFSLDTPEAFYDFVKNLRKIGVLKFANIGVSLDLTPGGHDDSPLYDSETEMKRQKIKDAFKTAQELEQEALLDENWSA